MELRLKTINSQYFQTFLLIVSIRNIKLNLNFLRLLHLIPRKQKHPQINLVPHKLSIDLSGTVASCKEIFIFIFSDIDNCFLVGKSIDFIYLDIILSESACFIEAEVLKITGFDCFIRFHTQDILMF